MRDFNMHQKLAINFDDCKPVNITSIVANVRNKYKKVNNMDANVLNIAMNVDNINNLRT